MLKWKNGTVAAKLAIVSAIITIELLSVDVPVATTPSFHAFQPVEADVDEDTLYNQCMAVEQCRLLAEMGYHEARGETDDGVAAVMHVVINRKHHDLWPNTVRGVITQKGQFSYRTDGSLARGFREKDQYKRVAILANQVWFGTMDDPTNGAVFYHNKTVKPVWAKKARYTGRIGSHFFYKI